MTVDPARSRADAPYAGYVETEQLDGLLEAAGVAGVREILAAFWRSTDGLVAELRGQIAREDRQGAMRSAHALKGSALNVGAIRFAETVRRIEDLCRSGDLAAAGAYATTAEAEYRQTVLAFEDSSPPSGAAEATAHWLKVRNPGARSEKVDPGFSPMRATRHKDGANRRF